MRFRAETSHYSAEGPFVCRPHEGRSKIDLTRAAIHQIKPAPFYWQVLGLTLVLLMAAAILGAAHGAEISRLELDAASATHVIDLAKQCAADEGTWEAADANAV